MDGLQNINFDINSDISNDAILTYKDFQDAEIDYDVLKFSKKKIPFEQAEATFMIINSVTDHKELSKYFDLPHGLKDHMEDNIFSFPDKKIWGMILNGTYCSTIENEEFFESLLKSFTKCPDFVKDAVNIQIISHRILKSEVELNLLRFIAKTFAKFFFFVICYRKRAYLCET